jgi:hypothetical protein
MILVCTFSNLLKIASFSSKFHIETSGEQAGLADTGITSALTLDRSNISSPWLGSLLGWEHVGRRRISEWRQKPKSGFNMLNG